MGAEHFSEVLGRIRGETAVAEWRRLQEIMKPLSSTTMALSPAAVRLDWGAMLTVGRFLPMLLTHAPKVDQPKQ